MACSPERILHLNEHLHTGHLRDASSELVKRMQDIVDFYGDRVSRVARVVGHHSAGRAIKEALNPNSLKEKAERKWTDREKQVTAILLAIKVMQDPHLVDFKLSEISTPVSPFEDAYKALEFLNLTFDRLESLLSDKPRGLGTLGRTWNVYVESRLLKRAIFNGVYLIPPRFM